MRGGPGSAGVAQGGKKCQRALSRGGGSSRPKARGCGFVYVPSCVPGNKPLADYQGKGEYLGECADGFMTRASECTEPANVGKVIFTWALWADDTGLDS